jgi:hypothetical protein
VSFFKPWFLWPETKKSIIPFLCISLFASLSTHALCHIGDFTNLARYPPLKPKISSFVFTSLTTTYHWVWIVNSRKIARWCQGWRFQVSLQRKIISSTYLISITSLPEDEQTSKYGGGGRYNAIRVQGKQMKKRWKNEKQNEKMSIKKGEIKKNMYEKRKIYIKIKWTPWFSKVH